jgi:hypothetical protein
MDGFIQSSLSGALIVMIVKHAALSTVLVDFVGAGAAH